MFLFSPTLLISLNFPFIPVLIFVFLSLEVPFASQIRIIGLSLNMDDLFHPVTPD
jgi:hypothetical protein